MQLSRVIRGRRLLRDYSTHGLPGNDWLFVFDHKSYRLKNLADYRQYHILLYIFFSSEDETKESLQKLHDKTQLKAFNHPQKASN